LHLALPFVSTLESDVKVKVQPRLSGKLDGVAFDSRGEALPFEDDASARLSLKLAGLDLAPMAAYLPASLPLRLSRGRLDVDLALDFAERSKGPPGIRLSGRLQLHELALSQPDGQPLLDLQRLSLPLADAQPLRRQLAFGQISIQSPSVWLRPIATPADSGGAAPPWQLSMAGLELLDGRLFVRDLALEAIEFKAGAAAWPLKAPVTAQASLKLGSGALTAKAILSIDTLTADAEVEKLALDRLTPWMALPPGVKLAAQLSGKAVLHLKNPLADGAAGRAQVTLRDVQLANARLSADTKPLLNLAGAQLDQAEIDAEARTLRLGMLRLDTPRAQTAREADGRLNLQALLPAETAASATGPSWKLQLTGMEVDRGALHWRDAAVPAGVAPIALAVEPLRMQIGEFSWPSTAPVQAQLTAHLAALGANDQPVAASAGRLQWTGRIGLAPLSASGSFQAEALPLQLLDAYLDPAWGLHLQRAELGLKSEVTASRQADGTWQAVLGGDLRVGPLAVLQARVVDGQRAIGEELLSWQALQLDGVKLAITPGALPRVSVRDALLDDAYARLIVNEKGRFNLRDIGPAEAASAAAAASAPTSAPSAAPAASAPPLQLSVERIRVNRGVVDFNDRFVKPNYSARLTELQGALGAFSTASPAMAPLTVRGKVAGTGLLEIDGQLKPGSPPAMDLAANATDIELAPLSVYAGKYTGYAIERGKLSARLRYKVEPGGELVASNQITLDQLTFGDKVESPDATTLPVRFAVALLKDRNGVVEVNLPVSGSLNDPEFSVAGLAWRLFLNLIGKAVTSPFSLFTGSDSSEEAQIAFSPATAELPADDKLDRIARQLADKPGVQLTLTGWADSETEVPALREQRLATALKAENAATPEAALKRLYEASKLPNKPRNVLGLAKDLPPAQMRGMLMASYDIDDEALRQLAVARAVAVRDALLARGAPNARVFLAAPKLCNGACESGWRPHVALSLDVH
ncbi:MAG: DUF748 domain-containing protein, partial [Rubrivivax sp.]